MTARLDIKFVTEQVRKNNGWVYKSGKYRNNNSKLNWLVPDCGHIISMDYSHAIRKPKRGCVICNRHLYTRLDINMIKKFCRNLDGELLTKKYFRNTQKLKIKCSCGKIFNKTWRKLQDGQWCQYCNPKSKGEEFVRKVFEKIFNASFPTKRLYNKLELDGFNESLKLAFEYQGIQHYKYNHFFHNKDFDNYKYALRQNKIKRNTCMWLGICLVEVPQFEEEIRIRLLKNFNRKCTKDNLLDLIKLQLPRKFTTIIDRNRIDYSKHIFDRNDLRINKLKEALNKTHRILIDYEDLNADSKVVIYCTKCDTLGPSRYKNIVNQNRKCRWCLSKTKLISLDSVNKILNAKGLILIGSFEGTRKKHNFKTPSGYILYELFSSIKNSSCFGDEFATVFQHRKSVHRLNKIKN